MEKRITITEREGKFILIDNGVETDVTALAKPDKHTGELWIHLDRNNSANREWCSVKQLRKKGGTITYEYKEARTNVTTTGTRKTVRDWLSPDDQLVYDELMARAEANKKAAAEASKKKPMTEEEKLRSQIARLTAKLEGMHK